jgi:hypothetical protein
MGLVVDGDNDLDDSDFGESLNKERYYLDLMLNHRLIDEGKGRLGVINGKGSHASAVAPDQD